MLDDLVKLATDVEHVLLSLVPKVLTISFLLWIVWAEVTKRWRSK